MYCNPTNENVNDNNFFLKFLHIYAIIEVDAGINGGQTIIPSPSTFDHLFIHNCGRNDMPLLTAILHFMHSFGRLLDDDYLYKKIMTFAPGPRKGTFPCYRNS